MDLSGVYSARARFGWVIGSVMIYGSGGVAMTPWDSSVLNLATSQKLGVRAELEHYGVAGWDLNLPTAGSTANQFQSYVARVGITWYFK
jgi:hypothetical protein